MGMPAAVVASASVRALSHSPPNGRTASAGTSGGTEVVVGLGVGTGVGVTVSTGEGVGVVAVV